MVDNFSARVMRNWDLDYAHSCDASSRTSSPSAFRASAIPVRGRITLATVRLCRPSAGYTLSMRLSRRRARRLRGFSYSDMAGGYSGALAVLIALWHRRRTGEGQFVDLSQFEALASLAGPALLDISVQRPHAGAARMATRRRRPAAPHGVYRCRPRGDDDDRWIAIAVRSQAEWERFVSAIGNPAWTVAPKVPHALPANAQSRGTRRPYRAMGRYSRGGRRDGAVAARRQSPPAWR